MKEWMSNVISMNARINEQYNKHECKNKFAMLKARMQEWMHNVMRMNARINEQCNELECKNEW